MQVFSHFRHRDSCTGREVRTPIEPLVGTLRHPAVNEECGRPDRPDLTVVAHDKPSSVRGCASGRWNCSEPFGKLHIENKGWVRMVLFLFCGNLLAGSPCLCCR